MNEFPPPPPLESLIRDVPDFPKPGILFKDITPLLQSPGGLRRAMDEMAGPYRDAGVELVVGAESRGFIFGTAIALALGAGFIPVRKPNKLPAACRTLEYELEYGTDTLQMHEDAIGKGQRVLMVDDLLATGGTMRACCDMVREAGGEIVGISVLIELAGLRGRELLRAFGEPRAVLTY